MIQTRSEQEKHYRAVRKLLGRPVYTPRPRARSQSPRARYMRSWRERKAAFERRQKWFPAFGCGDEGTYNSLRFIRDAGGPDSTQLGSSLRELAELGPGAPSLAMRDSAQLAGEYSFFHLQKIAIPWDLRFQRQRADWAQIGTKGLTVK